MKKKGSAFKQSKEVRKRPKRVVTNQWGYIPKNLHFCIICWLLDGVKNKKYLTVHHDRPRSKGGTNNLSNLEVICDNHHKQLHHPYFYSRVKKTYLNYRKAKFIKI